MSYSDGKLELLAGHTGGYKGNRIWSYFDLDTDTLATIKASGFFNSAQYDLTNGKGKLVVGDRIWIQGTDSYEEVVVTSVTTAVTVVRAISAALTTDNVVIGNAAKTSYTKVTGYTKFDARPTGGATYDYNVQLRMESGKTSGSVWGLDGETHMVADGTASIRSVQGVAVLDSGYTATDASYSGVYGQVRSNGTFTGSGFMSALYGLVEDGGAAITASHVCSQWLDSHLDQTVTGEHELAYWTNNGDTTMDRALYLYGGNKITAFVEFNTCAGMVSDTAETGGSSKKIKITIDGVVHYINAYTG